MDASKENENMKQKHPISSSNFFSKIFFLYTFNLLRRSSSKNVNYTPPDSDRSSELGDRLEKSWNKQKIITSPSRRKRKYCVIFQSVLSAFWTELLVTAIISYIEVFLRIVEPICLGYILKYFGPNSSMSEQEVLCWTVGMLVANGLRVVAYSQQRYHTLHTAMKIRVACSNLIYRKVLRLRSTTLQEDGGGKIVTLLSNDLSRFDMRTELINYVYTAPLVVIVVTFIMYQEFGMPGLVGVGLIFLITVIQAFFAHYVSTFHLLTASLTDERMRLMHSFLNGIQVIKMYAWDSSFAKLIDKARSNELNVIGRSFLVKAIYESIYTFIVPISIFAALFVVIHEHEQITVVMIFLMVIYYTLLNYMVSIFFTLGIAKLFELCTVLRRVDEFLQYEERLPEVENKLEETGEVCVLLQNVSASWKRTIERVEELEEDDYTERTALLSSNIKRSESSGKQKTSDVILKTRSYSLRSISLIAANNNFVGIIGPVGSGKSSLLQVILGELHVSSGFKSLKGKISYAPQVAWTFASTVRQNILFGLSYNESRYNEVIRVCGLAKDIQNFPEGDMTLIGDRGAALSGGQKARINLARAVYRDADVYLLDDPLAAVDVKVANHLINECVINFLANKCRILVTHHTVHLRTADKIICMNTGEIEEQGTYEDLIQSGRIKDDVETLESYRAQVEASVNNYSPLRHKFEYIPNPSFDLSTSSIDSSISENSDETKSKSHGSNEEKESLLCKYFFAGSGKFSFVFTLLLFIFNQALISGISYYLGKWSSAEEIRDQYSYLSKWLLHDYFGLHKKMFYEEWFGYLILILIAGALLKSFCYARLVKSNSSSIHKTLLENVTNTSLRFYDTTSSGRILNRFSRDIGVIDESLPRSVMEAVQIMLMAFGSFLLLIIVDLDFLIPTIVLNILFIGLLLIFSKITKRIKRMESKLIGPILTHVNTSAQGITTIKAHGAERVLTQEFENHQDNYTSSWFLYGTSSIALSFYVDLSCFLFLLYIALILVFYAKTLNISGGFVGMALTQAMSLTGVIQYGIRQSLEANNQLVAVERVSHYKNLPAEEEPELIVEPPVNWPTEGRVVFDDVGLRYDQSLPLVLKNLNLVVNPKEKVGIVGRTGAGKSSIMAALFRLCSVEGTIEIDGFDTRDIPLQLLRSKIAVIPQDPILFAGSLRFNLDPFNEFDDETLYKSLRSVELKRTSGELCSLDHKVTERGSNFSVGQRQLICLARALIRNNKILVLDEATANVDPGTDLLIQKTIRKEFGYCTVLTIAHRLNTVMDSDKVLVMDSGKIVEYDHPHVLLQNLEGVFYNMVVEAGFSEAEKLKKIAFDSYIGWKK